MDEKSVNEKLQANGLKQLKNVCFGGVDVVDFEM